MESFIPPPNYSTVRFDGNEKNSEKVKFELEEFIRNDIVSRFDSSPNFKGEIISHQKYIENHPRLNDVFVINHNSIKSSLKKLSEDFITGKKIDKEVIVDAKCGTSVLRGSHIFVPGVLSVSPGVYKNCIVSVYIDVDGKCLKGSKSFIGEKIYLGDGVVMFNRKQIFCNNGIKNGIAVKMINPIYAAPSLNNQFLPKFCFAQNLPSVVAGHNLNPPPGSIVLDMCAAPGGKSMHLCSIMNHNGHVIALDRSKSRVNKIEENAKLLQCNDLVHAYAVDSRYILCKNTKTDFRNDFKPPFSPNSFEYILLDAPCSGLGQRPRFGKKNRGEKELNSFPVIQRQLLETAVGLLCNGGVLVYCTCTVQVEENEHLVEWALEKFVGEIKLVKQSCFIGQCGRNGVSNLANDQLKLLQFFPLYNDNNLEVKQNGHHVDTDTIGFFIAKFKKI